MKNARTYIASVFLLAILLPSSVSAQTLADLQAQINALLEQVQKLQMLLGKPQGTEQWCHTFNTNLGIGSGGGEVANLVVALRKEKLDVGDTDYYDETVASAVTGFQEKYRSEILTPAGLKNGTGYVGGRTRAKLNTLYNCGSSERVPAQKPAAYQRQAPVFQPEEIKQETVPSKPTSQFGYPTPKAVLMPSSSSALQQSQGWIAQKTTCFFEGSVSQQLCSTVNKDGKKFVLYGTGNTTAVGTVFGYLGEMLHWQSSCGGAAYSTVGQSEQISFNCDTTKPTLSITLISPNGGELWQAGQSYPVSWRKQSPYRYVGVHLRKKGGGAIVLSGQDSSMALGTFETDAFMLSVPTEVVSGDDYIIEVINFDSAAETTWPRDISDAPFTIINPSPTEVGIATPLISHEEILSNQAPVITAIDGPTSLMAGEVGNWTIQAYDPEKTCLHYTVVYWGDGNGGEGMGGRSADCIYSATFTHGYQQNGYYKVLFQVTDKAGGSTLNAQEIYIK